MSALSFLETGDGDPADDCDDDSNFNGQQVNQLPEDLDVEKFDRGRAFFRKNVAQCLIAMLFSLVCGLSINRFLEVLVRTGKSSTPKTSFMRYMRTTVHVLKWHYGNVWNVSSSAYESILAVRKMHCSARRLMKERLSKKKITSGTIDSKSVYLSQYDMGLVQSGFMGAVIMYPEEMGIRCCQDDLDDYVYFWRWIGFLLGIKDKYNICIGGYESAYRICKAIDCDVLIPALLNPPEKFLPMARAFTDGIRQLSLIPWFTPESVVARYMQITSRKQTFSVSATDVFRIYLLRAFLAMAYYFPRFSSFFNSRVEHKFDCSKFD